MINAGGHVPGREVALPVAVEPTGRDPGEIERGGAEAAQARDLALHSGGFLRAERNVAAAGCGSPQAITASASRRRAATRRRCVVEERALAALGGKQVVVGGIVDQAGDDAAFALKCDRDREMRNAVQEVRWCRRADRPSRCGSCRCLRCGRLPRRGNCSPGRAVRQFLAQDLFGAAVGGGDEIGRPLERDLQVLDLAEVALERARRPCARP